MHLNPLSLPTSIFIPRKKEERLILVYYGGLLQYIVAKCEIVIPDVAGSNPVAKRSILVVNQKPSGWDKNVSVGHRRAVAFIVIREE